MIAIKSWHFNRVVLLIILSVCLIFMILPLTEIEELKNNQVINLVIHNEKVHYEISDNSPDWVKISKMGNNIQSAVVVSEDWSFWNHHGFDLSQIYLSLKNKILDNRRLRGASTISQQLVKNLFLTHERSYKRKLLEVIISAYMELRLTKKQILEIYLNIIEYGDGIYGIKSAAHRYFNKHPNYLSAREAAYLSMLIPNPKVRSQAFTSRNSKLIDIILKKMKVAKYLSKYEYKNEIDNKFFWEI